MNESKTAANHAMTGELSLKTRPKSVNRHLRV
jgi:hypothetical protein